MRRIIILTAALLWSFQPAAASDAPAAQDAFMELNTVSREAYSAIRNEVIPPDQAIFLVTDKLTLIRGGELGTRPIVPAIYRELKDISHLQLGVMAQLPGSSNIRALNRGSIAWRRCEGPAWMPRALLLVLCSMMCSASARLLS